MLVSLIPNPGCNPDDDTISVRLANLVIAVSYLSLLDKLTPAGTYGLYTGFCIVGYIFVLFCYPETSKSGRSTDAHAMLIILFSEGLSIDETEHLFLDDFGVKKSVAMRKEKVAMAKQLKTEVIA